MLLDLIRREIAACCQRQPLAGQIAGIGGQQLHHRICRLSAAADDERLPADVPDGDRFGPVAGVGECRRLPHVDRRRLFFRPYGEQAGAQPVETSDDMVGQDADGRLDADQRGDTDSDDRHRQQDTAAVG